MNTNNMKNEMGVHESTPKRNKRHLLQKILVSLLVGAFLFSGIPDVGVPGVNEGADAESYQTSAPGTHIESRYELCTYKTEFDMDIYYDVFNMNAASLDALQKNGFSSSATLPLSVWKIRYRITNQETTLTHVSYLGDFDPSNPPGTYVSKGVKGTLIERLNGFSYDPASMYGYQSGNLNFNENLTWNHFPTYDLTYSSGNIPGSSGSELWSYSNIGKTYYPALPSGSSPSLTQTIDSSWTPYTEIEGYNHDGSGAPEVVTADAGRRKTFTYTDVKVDDGDKVWIQWDYEVPNTTTVMVPPNITAGNRVIPIGGAIPGIAASDGVYAESGYTNKPFSGYGGTYDGTVESVSHNINVNAPGTYTQTLKATDNTDGTTKETTRNITVQGSLVPPVLDIKYASDNSPYDGKWTNGNLNFTVSTTEPNPENYNTALLRNGTVVSSTPKSATHTVANYGTASASAVGDNFTGKMLANSNPALDYSPATVAQRVYIDKTPPIPGATYNSTTGVFTNTSTDALSGSYDNAPSAIANPSLGTGPLDRILIVPAGLYADAAAATANASGYSWTAFSSPSIPAPGSFDIWVRAYDNAGNSAVARGMANQILKTSDTPNIKGYISPAASVGIEIASDTWTNKDVYVEVTDKLSVLGTHWLSYFDNTAAYPAFGYIASGSNNSSTPPAGPVGKTYSAEQISTAYGVYTDVAGSAATEISSRASYIVKIDKTKPLARVALNPSGYDFTDISKDALGTDPANYDAGSAAEVASSLISGIDTSATEIAVVPTGDTPTAGDYVSVASASVPSGKAYYDVWVIAKDNAGNVSDAYKQYTHINRAGLDEIRALDFARGINQGAISSGDIAKQLAHATGVYYGGGKIDINDLFLPDAAQLANINDKIAAKERGIYPLTISTPLINPNYPSLISVSNTTNTISINVRIYDEGDGGDGSGESLFADNFNYAVDDPAMTDAIARDLSHLVAYDKDGAPLSLTLVETDPLAKGQIDAIKAAQAAKTIDKFPITYRTPDGQEVTIYCTLYLKSNPPGTNKARIFAMDFTYGLDEPAITDQITRNFSHVVAVDKDGFAIADADITTDATQLSALIAHHTAGDIGRYPLTYTEPSGEAVTIQVTLYSHGGPNPPIPGNAHITANDFDYAIDQPAITDAITRQLSHVSAVTKDGFTIPLSNITTDATQLAALIAHHNNGELGVYPLTYTEGVDNTSVTVNVRLKDHGSPLDPDKAIITAFDFSYAIDQAPITDAMTRTLSHVSAADQDGFPIADTDITTDTVQLDDIKNGQAVGRVGFYPLTYTETLTGQSVTINVKLTEHGGPDPTKAQITANDFEYAIDQPAITDAITRGLSHVAARDKDGFPLASADITTDATQLIALIAHHAAGEVGFYPLTYTETKSGTGQAVTISVKLTGHGGSDPTKAQITANDFDYAIDQPAITDDITRLLSHVTARDNNGFLIAPADITTNATQLNAIVTHHAKGELGLYPLTYTETKSGTGQAVTINVRLTDHGGPKPPVAGQATINANDFDYAIDQAPITDAMTRLLSHVAARDKDGFPIADADITTNTTELNAIIAHQAAGEVGRYPLTYTETKSPGNESVIIHVTLKDHGGPKPPVAGKATINALDFSYGVDQPAITDAMTRQLSHVKAVDKDGFPIADSDITTNATELAALIAHHNNGETGVYPLTYTEGVDNTSVTVNVKLYDHGGPKPPVAGKASIYAFNFSYAIDQAPITDAMARQLSHVKAVDKDGFPLADTNITVDAAQLNAIIAQQSAGKIGVYPLTYTESLDNTSVIIAVTLYDHGGPKPPVVGKATINANDFEYGLDQPAITDAITRVQSSVNAQDKDGFTIPLASITTDAAQLAALIEHHQKGETGVYPLTYTEGADNTSVTINVTLVVKGTSNPPVLDIKYASDSSAYDGRWTNGNLNFTVSTTEPNTASYDSALLKNGTVLSSTPKSATHTVTNYGTNSPATGDDFTGKLLVTSNPTLDYSPATAAQKVYIDKTPPTPGATYDSSSGVFTDTSTDALSGSYDNARSAIANPSLGTGLLDEILIVPVGFYADAAAAIANVNIVGYVWTSFSSPMILGAGSYDVWVKAYDNAGNSAVAKGIANLPLSTSSTPNIKGYVNPASNAGTVLASDTWTNKDVYVEVTDNALVLGTHWLSYFDDTALPPAFGYIASGSSSSSTPPAGAVGKTYSAEQISNAYGVMTDAASVLAAEVSARVSYIVKIDKTKPLARAALNASGYDFTDISRDALNSDPTNYNAGSSTEVASSLISGIDTSATEIAVVPTGDTPAAGDYVPAASASVPSGAGYYDVYVIAKDNAGNVSDAYKQYTHINRAGLDEIRALDFARGINQGVINSDDIAKQLAHATGVYYGGGDIAQTDLFLPDAAQLIAINAKIAAGERGIYSLTISTPLVNPNYPSLISVADTTNTISINVRIYDEGDGGDGSGESLFADNFNYAVDDPAMTDAIARDLSHLVAYDKDGAPLSLSLVTTDPLAAGQIDAIRAAQAAKTIDKFPITYQTPDGHKVTIYCTLYSKGNPPGSGKARIFAMDFTYGLDEPTITDQITRTFSHVVAVDQDGFAIAGTDITTDLTELANLIARHNAGDIGRYPLTYTEPSGESVTIQVTLYAHGGPIPPNYGKAHITANDFDYAIDQPAITDAMTRQLSHVSAVTKDGFTIPLASITTDATELAALIAHHNNGETGVYPLTYTEGVDNTSVTVNVRLADHGGPKPPTVGKDIITAFDFSYGCDSPDLTDGIAKQLSHVKAQDKDGFPISLSNITTGTGSELANIVAAQHTGKTGFYPLTFTTPDGTSVTIRVTLRDHGPNPPTPGNNVITGNDFSVGKNETVTADSAKDLAAVDLRDKDGNLLDLTYVTTDPSGTQLSAINNGKLGDVFPLTFTEPGGESITVQVTIKDQGDGTGRGGTGHVAANNFTYQVKATTITADIARMLSAVVASDKDGHGIAQGGIGCDTGQLATIASAQNAHDLVTLPLTFTNGDGAVCTIMVTLADSDVYKVTYHSSGHTSGSVPTATSHSYGDKVALKDKGSLLRTDYTFKGWDTNVDAKDVKYTAGTVYTIKSNVDLYAVWEKDAVTPPVIIPPVVTPPTITPPIVDPIVAPVDTNTEITPLIERVEPRADTPAEIDETNLSNNGIPLGGFSAEGVCSLLSMILSLLALAFTFALTITALLRRKQRGDVGYNGSAYESDENRRKGLVIFALAIIFGALTPIVWLILDNLGHPMVWINQWTIFVIAVFVIHIAFMIAHSVRKKKENRETLAAYE